MKIKNISNKSLEINFVNHPNSITLKEGQIVYCKDVDYHTSLKILAKKNLIEIKTDDPTPSTVELYHPYGCLPHSEILKLKNQSGGIALIIDEDEDEEEEIEVIPVIPTEIEIDDIETDNSDVDVALVDDEESSGNTPKRGRPKGSFKTKKGRPKKKRPRGRPSKKKNITSTTAPSDAPSAPELGESLDVEN